jgi:citrate synthase
MTPQRETQYGRTVAGTSIATMTEDAIYVRDRDLVAELIGKVDFTSMLIFHLRGRFPEAGEKAVVDSILVTLMEHGLTPSTISARLIYDSSPDALQGAVAGGLLAAGTNFLGSMEGMAELLQEGVRQIEAGESDAATYARETLERLLGEGVAVPGFGHKDHHPDDPRTETLLGIAREHGLDGPHAALLAVLATTMDELKGRHITVNATGAIAANLSDLGYPWQIMRGFSLVARAAGIVGHLLEEQSEPLAREMWELIDHSVPYQGEVGKGGDR